MQGLKLGGKSYKVVKPLFQINSYLYAQVCAERNNYDVQTAALYVYENEDPSQCLKMLKEKLAIKEQSELANLIFPYHLVKDELHDKNIALFFINDYLMPLNSMITRDFGVAQYLQLLHGGLSCLNQMHMRDITHGNINLSSCYLKRQKNEARTRFAFNILDTHYFTEDESSLGIEQRLFQSEGQSLGQTVSFKDDLQSLVYVMTHLISKGKLFTVQRFQLEWITQSEFSRWKNCQFFKQMVRIIPPELQILVEIYTVAKSMRRNEKPDYLKLLKKNLNAISASNRNVRKTVSKIADVINKESTLSDVLVKKQKQNVPNSISQKDIRITLDEPKKKAVKHADSIRQTSIN